MKVEFKKSFEKDLSRIREAELLKRIQTVIEEIETVNSLSDVTSIKKLKAEGNVLRSFCVSSQ